MPHVVLLRGINVGGHKTLRPTSLARQLRHLGVVSIGAAGTFVVRQRVSRTRLRDELVRRLPLDAGIVICDARELLSLVARDPFARQVHAPDVVRFVSFLPRLPRLPRSAPELPVFLPARRGWLVQVLARHDRFVLGLYRRHMRTIGCLGALDRLFGLPLTTRNWNTVLTLAKVISDGAAGPAAIHEKRSGRMS